MSTENTPQGLSLDQAFAQLQASRAGTQETEQANVGADEEVVEEFDEEEEVELEETELDEEESEDEDDDLESEEDDEAGEDSGEEEDIFEVEVDGETVEVTGEELRKGYLRHNDYTRKRQADAKAAKELKAEYDSKLAQLNEALAMNISQEQQQFQQLQQQYGQETDEAKKRNIHYQLLQLQSTIGQRNQQLQQAKDLQAQAIKAQQEAYWKEQEEALQARYENWDAKKQELVGYLQAEGFEDLSMFGHHKMAELVDKAKQFDELQQTRKSVVSKKLRRKVPKVVKPGQGERKLKVNQQRIKQLEAQFARTGSIKDAMALQKARKGN